MTQKSDYAVFVLRAQPFHNAHLRICQEALKKSNQLILVLGSYKSPKTLKNPFSFEERKEMINATFLAEGIEDFIIIPQKDFTYQNNTWIANLYHNVKSTIDEFEVTLKKIEIGTRRFYEDEFKDLKIDLIGHYKDDSSEYLSFFPQWNLNIQPSYYSGINATDIRNLMFENYKEDEIKSLYEINGKLRFSIPKTISKYLQEWMETEDFKALQKEYNFIKNYKKKWEGSPFQPTFITVDSVVIKSGHILVVKRGRNPGIGKYALPGGFIDQTSLLFENAIRELKEETKLPIKYSELKKCLKKVDVFDHPSRGERGRTITHAHLFHLTGGGQLPIVKGSDDAESAFWMPLCEVASNEENFFDDHMHIIHKLIENI